jgi:Flp pilus assembly protein CpaB
VPAAVTDCTLKVSNTATFDPTDRNDPTYGQLVATSTIQPGELVMTTRFAARGTTTGTLPVPAGMLAVTVALDDPSHVGSFLSVGSKVAVFDTFNVQSVTAAGTGTGSTGTGSAAIGSTGTATSTAAPPGCC